MDSEQEIRQWRRQERARLIEARLAVPPALRQEWSEAIERALSALLPALSGRALGIYWPHRAEFDPRPLAERLIAKGWRCALPAVIDRESPLDYRPWQPDAAMEAGAYDIPVPTTRATVRPEILLVPLLGFDSANYRLGYGGGYFDRTLAALAPRPLAIGVGFELGRLPSVFPRPHDIPMDVIVTERQMQRR
jgi:5-formyltetrahydrofolate cyclo-ligase